MTYQDFYNSIKTLLVNNQFANKIEIIGYSNMEIKAFEELYKYSLPESYKEFLKVFGESDLAIFNNQYFGLDQIDASFSVAKRLLEAPIQSDNFVFIQWQGSNFHYFKLSDNQNPDVIFITETDHPIILELEETNEGCFSDWVCELIIKMLNLKIQLKKGDFSNQIEELKKLKQQLTPK